MGTRNDALDGIRAFAVMGVVLMHEGVPIRIGGFGVPVFFVLSGFLITRNLLGEYAKYGGLDLRSFYLNRFIRLAPAMLFLFAILLPYCAFVAPPPFGIATLWGMFYCLFAFQNWAAAYYTFFPYGWLGVLGHTWSLAVEWQFYLVWPLVFTLLVRKARVLSMVTMGLLVIVEVVYRQHVWDTKAPLSIFVNSTHLHCDGLLMGSLLALYLAEQETVFSWQIFGLIPLAMMCKVFSGLNVGISYALFFVEIAAVLLIAHFVVAKRSLIKIAFGAPPLAYLGRISYSLYLWHYAIHVAMVASKRFDMNDGKHLVLELGLSFAGAIASYHLVEQPVLQLFRRAPATASGLEADPIMLHRRSRLRSSWRIRLAGTGQ